MKSIFVLPAMVAALVPTAAAEPQLVDPRTGGFGVALGEWTVVPEAREIRPGSVTIVVVNRGRLSHGLRVRAAEHGDRGRDGSGLARTRVLAPGERATIELDLAAGTYELECFIEDGHGDHDDLGMRALLQVRDDAPLVAPAQATSSRPIVRIRGFGYEPGTLRVKRGQTIRWTNDDVTAHTITAKDGTWSSRQIGKGGAFQHRFTRSGAFVYFCALHPGMRAKVVVR